ncbi:hypothetical protein EYF80_039297 [Liparis tanakae]|uniref:Uncharacterized protein n=1 Tax=Liparis tanakae TaxID=230148 RepID=A0A4Z2GA87_9TELE|nr:hypothetical protein EYF80_039297 [Liparis tanakae]
MAAPPAAAAAAASSTPASPAVVRLPQRGLRFGCTKKEERKLRHNVSDLPLPEYQYPCEEEEEEEETMMDEEADLRDSDTPPLCAWRTARSIFFTSSTSAI